MQVLRINSLERNNPSHVEHHINLPGALHRTAEAVQVFELAEGVEVVSEALTAVTGVFKAEELDVICESWIRL